MAGTSLTKEQLDTFKKLNGKGLKSASAILSNMIGSSFSAKIKESAVSENINCTECIPGIVICLEFSGGLYGKAVLVLKNDDVMSILNTLMSDVFSDENGFELDEFAANTVSEIVSKMAAAYSMAFSAAAGKNVMAAVSRVHGFADDKLIREEIFSDGGEEILVSRCSLNINMEGESTWFALSSCTLVKSFIKLLRIRSASGDRNRSSVRKSEGQPMYPYSFSDSGLYDGGDELDIRPAQFPNFSENPTQPSGVPLVEQDSRLVMKVPLDVTIEIGKTKRKMSEILDFEEGSVITLDKQAGAPVDLVVNNKLIAKGDVVVIDENFAVRITEIVASGLSEKKAAMQKDS